MNRHVKSQHKTAYHEWTNQLDQLSNKSQKRMSDVFMKTNETKRKSSNSKSFYNNNHPRQIQLSQSILENLIVDLGLPLSIVERDAFIKFMNVIDPTFAMTSRRTLSRTIIPRLYTATNDELKKCCNQSNFISLTLDIWTDRRLRAFFAMTGHAFVDNTLKSYVLCFLPLHGSHTANFLLQTYENVIRMFDIQTKLVRLVTDNAANNIKAFENLIIPDFEHYFNIEDDDNDEIESDIDLDGFSDDDDDDAKEESYNQVIHGNAINIIEPIKHSFDNIAANSESLRIPRSAHTIQLVINDGLKQISSIQSALVKVSKIAKLSHTSTIFAEKLEHIGSSLLTSLISRFGGLLEELDVIIDKSIPQKSSSELYRDQIFIYSPFLDGKCKLHWIVESSLPLEIKNVLCENIKNLICDHCIVFQHNNSSTTTPRLNATDDDQSSKTATAKITPKRKSLFSNIERKNIKKQKLDNLAFIKDEINIYLNGDESDLNRFILIDQSIKYKALNYLAKKVFTVPATSSPVERVFSQSGFIFRQHR
ncbi:unnamed protein product [Rotaria socialis]|uniref:HAT C-terminal dimerisation domain-containing protein n=1 Tax=Rotaria socialis TaxID=392032 RepID=A0A819BDU5_9BILA|nr:unnamed protein product [Rotaria socialis]CAF4891722.1 unnamed protein product [Rotaria socialis]